MTILHVEFSSIKTVTEGTNSLPMVDAVLTSESITLSESRMNVTTRAQTADTAKAFVELSNPTDRWVWFVIAATPTMDLAKRRLMPPKSTRNFACANGDKVGAQYAII